MLNRRFIITAFAALIAAGAPALAFDGKAFDQQAFESAQAAGQPILVEVTAPWCPVCKAQAPILSSITADAKYKNMVRFNIDFDTQKDLLKKFNVRSQSTLIAFKGKSEVGRSTGDTDPGRIAALIAKSI